MTSFSVAIAFAVGECFGFGVADCSGAAIADCVGVGVGLSGSETGAGDRCARSNNKLPNRTKRIMGFISKLNSRNDGTHEVFLGAVIINYVDLARDRHYWRTSVPATL